MSAPAAEALRGRRIAGPATLGIWVFLASEVLFFGVLFFGYLVTRLGQPAAFAAASRHTDIVLGSLNTAVLLTSSLTMALAVRLAQLGHPRRSRPWLAATFALGALFMGLKLLEYTHDYGQELVPWLDFRFAPAALADGARLFFLMYFVMTGAHAVHLCVGLALLVVMVVRLGSSPARVRGNTAIEVTGLYWHLIDIVWIFLYPLLYLVSRT